MGISEVNNLFDQNPFLIKDLGFNIQVTSTRLNINTIRDYLGGSLRN